MTKAIVVTKTLVNAVKDCKRVAPSKSSNPGLSLMVVRLQEDTGIQLSCTNQDVDFRVDVDADVDGTAAFALPVHDTEKVLKLIPGDTVAIEHSVGEDEDGNATVAVSLTSDGFTVNLDPRPIEKAPRLDFVDTFTGEWTLEGFYNALDLTGYARATEDYQAVFRHSLLEMNGHTRAVATDGFRLAWAEFDHVTGIDATVLIPGSTAKTLGRILKPLLKAHGSDGIGLQLARGSDSGRARDSLAIGLANRQFVMKLAEGAFPDWERVVPASFPVELTLDAKTLADTVKRVSAMAEKTANYRVDFWIKDGVLTVKAEGPLGSAEESLEVNQAGPESELAAAFNAKYLEDALKPMDGSARIAFSGSTSPTLIRPVEDNPYNAMVVPLRTG